MPSCSAPRLSDRCSDVTSSARRWHISRPAGTFAEEALRASAPQGAEIEEIPYASVYETVMAVQHGEADRAVVPIENSLEGSVTATLDALAGEADRVRIAAEVVRPIEHCLVVRPGLGLEAVRRVISHPQAIPQCEQFLPEHLPDAERATVESTAEAVQRVAESDEPWAAIGSRISAELYRCRLLGEPRPVEVAELAWVAPADLGNYQVLPADIPLCRRLQREG